MVLVVNQMLTDVEELDAYLKELPQNDFIGFCLEIDLRIEDPSQIKYPHLKLNKLTVTNYSKVAKSKDEAFLRADFHRRILASKHELPALFERACHRAGIKTDAAKALFHGKQTTESATEANAIARDANQIAKQALDLAKWSLAIAVIAAIIALGGFFVSSCKTKWDIDQHNNEIQSRL